VHTFGFVSKNWNGYGLGFLAARYQDYQSTAPGDFIAINHAPSVEFSTVERTFSRTDLVYAYDLNTAGVSRNEIGFSTAPIVGRIDASPYIALPKFLHGWTFRPRSARAKPITPSGWSPVRHRTWEWQSVILSTAMLPVHR